MKDFLIAYSKENKSLVKKLVSKLESDGISCWVSPRDFNTGDKDALISVTAESKILLLIVDKAASTNNEINEALKICLDKQIEVIPFVIDKIESNLYSNYFFHVLSWVDAYEDSFEEAYELLIDAFHELTGEKKVANKKPVSKKGQAQGQKINPVIYPVAAIILLIIGYFIFQGFGKDENAELLIGHWKLSNYQDNLPRNRQDSLILIQNLQNLKLKGSLTFNEDHTFERRGFSPEPQIGNWEINDEKTILFLEPVGVEKKDQITIGKLNEHELVLVANELVDSFNVTTSLFFSK